MYQYSNSESPVTLHLDGVTSTLGVIGMCGVMNRPGLEQICLSGSWVRGDDHQHEMANIRHDVLNH